MTVETPSAYNLKLSSEMCPQSPDDKKAAAKLPYQALVGSLIYATKTRFDVAYDVSNVARFMSNWGAEHLRAAMRVLKYLYSTREKSLMIRPPTGDKKTIDSLRLSVYCDANYGDDRDSGEEKDDKWKSQGGFLVLLDNSLISWRSRRHK